MKLPIPINEKVKVVEDYIFTLVADTNSSDKYEWKLIISALYIGLDEFFEYYENRSDK